MAEGRLRCCGSSLFLKKFYGVGYQLVIEKKTKFKGAGNGAETGADKNIDNDIKDIVCEAVREATVLSEVGTEMSFRLPLAASGKFVPMLEQLDEEVEKGRISNYGVSITTLDEVFLLVARGDEKDKQDFQSSHFSSKNLTDLADDDERSVKSKMDLDNEGLFGTHMQALLKKRAANFKRDKRAWCCTTILPSIFVLVGLLVLKYAGRTGNLEALPLDLEDYNIGIDSNRNPIPFNNPGVFSCAPGKCSYDETRYIDEDTGEEYSFCGGPALNQEVGAEYFSCSIADSDDIISAVTEAGAVPYGGDVSDIYEVGDSMPCVLCTNNVFVDQF
jgi:hypothetical protein